MQQYIDLIGGLAAFLTTSALLPQVIKIVRFKQTRDLSLIMYIIFCVGIALWLTYGILIQDYPLICANAITLVFGLIILVYKIRCG